MDAMLATHLWQSTAFAAGAALLAWFLRANHARTRHLVWLAASVKFLIPFSALVAIGRLFAWRSAIRLPSVIIADAAVDGFVPVPSALSDVGVAVDTAARTAPQDMWAGVSTSLPSVLLVLWVAGALLVLGVWLFRWLALARTLDTATPLLSGREVGILRTIERAHGSLETPLLISTGSLEPGVVGCLQPVILWPASISAHLTDEQIEGILLHELAHIRRYDNLLALVHMAVQTVFWFHPLVWWIGARLVDERERACDEDVVRLGADPHQYAESILRTCEYAVASPLVCVAGVTGADLKRRIRAIVQNEPSASLGRAKVALLTLVGILCLAGPIGAGALTINYIAAEPAAPFFKQIAAGSDERLLRFNLRRRMVVAEADATPATDVSAADNADRAARADTRAGDTAERAARAEARANGADARAIEEQTSRLKFEVASIKLLPPGNGGTVAIRRIGGQPGGRFNHTGSIRALLQQVYQIPFVRQIGGPDWIREDNYIINAKGPDDVPTTPENMTAMVRALLADRFKLVMREEVRELPVYELVLGRDDKRLGPNLARFTIDCSVPRPTAPGDPDECNKRMMSSRDRILIQNQPISGLASLLEGPLQRPIINSTGLEGNFNLDLHYTPDQALAAGVDAEYPSLFTALVEQLGLKLESKKAPVKVLVIDSIQRPTED